VPTAENHAADQRNPASLLHKSVTTVYFWSRNASAALKALGPADSGLFSQPEQGLLTDPVNAASVLLALMIGQSQAANCPCGLVVLALDRLYLNPGDQSERHRYGYAH
jgi:hypothetical protein